MAWRRSTLDPTEDPAAPEAIAAFDQAQDAGMNTTECYQAAVAAARHAALTPPDPSRPPPITEPPAPIPIPTRQQPPPPPIDDPPRPAA